MRSRASCATYGSSAMTAATSWPWNRTLSVARTAWVSPERVGIHARLWAARSAPVTTATTPGSAAAAEVSMDAMRAWGTGLRRTAACSIRGRTMSSTKRPAPRRKRSSSLRRSECPMPPIPGGVAWVVGCSVVVIVALLALGGGGRRSGMYRRPAHRLHDVHVARAAAQVPGDGPADLVLAGVGVAVKQRPADQHHRRRAEPALQAVALLEALLDGVELAVARQALDGGDRPAVGLHREQRAGLHRRAVEHHRAHPAARGVAPDMGAGEAQVGPHEVGQEHPGLDVVAALDTVDGDRDLHGRPLFRPRWSFRPARRLGPAPGGRTPAPCGACTRPIPGRRCAGSRPGRRRRPPRRTTRRLGAPRRAPAPPRGRGGSKAPPR